MKYNFLTGSLLLVFILSCKPTRDISQNLTAETSASLSLPYEKFTLANGLEVVLHEDHSDPIVAVATLMHVGSNREKPGKTGFAHFFEHMSFNDSENTPAGANRKLIPEWGGVRNGGTWTDGTIYYEVVPADAFDKILWIDSDRLGYMINTVTQEALEAEIQVVKNEKRQRVDNAPYGFTDEIIKANLYPEDHPYHWPVIGSLPDLQAATLKDVKEFYDTFYGANNATLVIAGDINIGKTKEKVQQWFGEIRRGPDVKPLKPKPAVLKETKAFYFEDNFARLPELRLVFPTVENYHPDMYALNILGQLLSGSRKSPLYKIIVEQKKQASDVSTYQNSNELAGEFVFRIRANSKTDLNEVKASVDEGLALFEKEPFTDSELQRIKAEQETALYQGVETVLDKAFTLAQDNEFAGDPAYIIQSARLTQSVTREDILKVYRRYVKGKYFVMTSVVPKTQSSLVVEGSVPASVWQEPIVAEVENENVSRGEEAHIQKTPSKFDRSEPAFGEKALFKTPEIWEATLNNGLAVSGIENKEIPLIYFDITIPGGHSFDPLEKAGVASLLAQLMKQGTAMRTPSELEEAIGLLGSTINVQCTNEEILIHAQCLARNFRPTFSLVKEMLFEPRWDVTEYQRLKLALETNLKGVEANAMAIASRNFNRLLYGPDHILGLPLNGTPETSENITLNDLKDFYSSYFHPSESAFHITGSISREEVMRQVKTLEENWKATESKFPSCVLKETGAGGNVYFIDFPDAKQSVVFTGKLVVSANDSDFNNVDFANEILGGGSSGKLFQSLRVDKGYTYGAYSFVSKGKEISPFTISTSVRSNATLPSLLIIQSLLAEYGQSFSEQDVEVTREKILKNNTRAFESLGAKLDILREITKYGKSKDFIEQDQQELLSMTRQQFQTVINRYMKEEDMIYLIVGDKASQFEEVARLKGKITELDINGRPIGEVGK